MNVPRAATNALRVKTKVWAAVNFYLGIQSRPKQIEGMVAIN
jgi:hypothetical protein